VKRTACNVNAGEEGANTVRGGGGGHTGGLSHLRHAPGHRRDAVQVELAEDVVVLGEAPLSLVHLTGGERGEGER
jgi:hypothetical protein